MHLTQTLICAALVTSTLAALASGADAKNYTVLHEFGPLREGHYPDSDLSVDKNGNIYGTTYEGGGKDCGGTGCGTIFKVTRDGHVRVLHRFDGADGALPTSGVTIMSKTGDLYGATSTGDDNHAYGTLWHISADGTFSTVHTFAFDDGDTPTGRLIPDGKGNLYGVTPFGGTLSSGVIYKLTPKGVFSVVHNFTGGTNGAYPSSRVTLDKFGNLYGAAAGGGNDNHGTIYKIGKDGTFTTLLTFNGSDGDQPEGGLARDGAGNLFGTTAFGGENNLGVTFKLAPDGIYTILHSFAGGNDGEQPYGDLILVGTTLYGTTLAGGGSGCSNGCGSIFSIAQDGTETLLHSLSGTPHDGSRTSVGLVERKGLLYGTAFGGGSSDDGIVFSLKR